MKSKDQEMELHVYPVNFNADRKLLRYVQKKVGNLNRFFEPLVDGHVYLKLNNKGGARNKTVEIKLNAPGHQVFAADDAMQFETACNRATDSAKKQLRKLKTRVTRGRA